MLPEQFRLLVEQTLLHLQADFLAHRLDRLCLFLLVRQGHTFILIGTCEDSNEGLLQHAWLWREAAHCLVRSAVAEDNAGALDGILEKLLAPRLALLTYGGVGAFTREVELRGNDAAQGE